MFAYNTCDLASCAESILHRYRQVNCELVWASDEAAVAIKYSPFDGDAHAPLPMDAVWNTLHTVDVATRQIQAVSQTPSHTENALLLGDVIWSPDCRCAYR